MLEEPVDAFLLTDLAIDQSINKLHVKMSEKETGGEWAGDQVNIEEIIHHYLP